MSDKTRYHHGDLHNALLAAALEIAAEDGLDGLSLRAVAARAGVSHAAPAHHFPTLKHLMTALATLAFERFRATMEQEIARAPKSAKGGMAGAGDGYVRFARLNPQLFRLMFSPSRLDRSDAALREAGRAAYGTLAAVCAPVAESRGETSPEARRQLELLVWSCVHGYAQLLLAGQLGGFAAAEGAQEPPRRPDLEGLLLGRDR